jgi:hypothetical protein
MRANVMEFEDVKFKKPSAKTSKKIALSELDKFSDGQIIWHVAKRRKFGLLLTFTVVYVAFTLFGTLIVGLIESLIR